MKTLCVFFAVLILYGSALMEGKAPLRPAWGYKNPAVAGLSRKEPNDELDSHSLSWPEQIKASLARAGFNREQIHIMYAISLAENHFQTLDRLGDLHLQTAKWGPSIGYLQIRTLKIEPKGCRRIEVLKDNLDAQSSCAYQIWKKQGYAGWSTYTTTDPKRSYKQFL